MTEADWRQDPEAARVRLEQALPDPIARRVVLDRLLRSADLADSIAPKAWSLTLYDDGFRLNVGSVEAMVAGGELVRLNLASEIDDLPFASDSLVPTSYDSTPKPQCAFHGPLAEFASHLPQLSLAHEAFIRRAAVSKKGTPRQGSTWRKSHSPGALEYARQFLKGSLHEPELPSPWVSNDEELVGSSFLEGAPVTLRVSGYERNRRARLTCLEHWGRRCSICGLDPEAHYGVSATGFIAVHHIKPISAIGAEYAVDPITDLRPVCPNCHAVIHSRKEPLSLAEAREILKKAAGAGPGFL